MYKGFTVTRLRHIYTRLDALTRFLSAAHFYDAHKKAKARMQIQFARIPDRKKENDAAAAERMLRKR